MGSAKMIPATSISAVLAFWLLSTATAATKELPGDKPARGSPVYTDISDAILVSFDDPWKDAHSVFARLLRRPITTWSVYDDEAVRNIITSFDRAKKPVFFTVNTSKIQLTWKKQGVTWFTCSSETAARYALYEFANYLPFTPPEPWCEAGSLAINETSIENFLWPEESSTGVTPTAERVLGKLSPLMRYNVETLSGSEVTVACPKRCENEGAQYTCEDDWVMKIFALLDVINVTAKRVESCDVFDVLNENLNGIVNNSDIALVPVHIYPDTGRDFDFHVNRNIHDAFYARVVVHRVVSLLEVAGECWKLVSATVALLALVVLVSVVIGGKDESITRGISDTSLFLLAAVLGTSAPLPKLSVRAGIVPKALIGLWLAIIVPLSVYFRSELTALIMLKRPADPMDTLQELEVALERRKVTPCLPHDTREFFVNATDTELLPRVLRKLWLDFLRRKDDTLITYNQFQCLQCASRWDHVCYDHYGPRATNVFQKRRNVKAFEEYIQPWRLGFLMPKFRPLYKPLGKFFRDIEEHKLIVWEKPDPENENAETELDVSGLLTLLVTLHAASCLVLVLEVVVARRIQRA